MISLPGTRGLIGSALFAALSCLALILLSACGSTPDRDIESEAVGTQQQGTANPLGTTADLVRRTFAPDPPPLAWVGEVASRQKVEQELRSADQREKKRAEVRARLRQYWASRRAEEAKEDAAAKRAALAYRRALERRAAEIAREANERQAAARAARKEEAERAEQEALKTKSAILPAWVDVPGRGKESKAERKDRRKARRARFADEVNDGRAICPDEGCLVGDIVIGVTQAFVGRVPLERAEIFGPRHDTKAAYLAIKLVIANTSETQSVAYDGWTLFDDSALEMGRVCAEDGRGNALATGFAERGQPRGRAVNANIYPLRSATDVLVFARPVDMGDGIKLTFIAQYRGNKKRVKLFVPADMIGRGVPLWGW